MGRPVEINRISHKGFMHPAWAISTAGGPQRKLRRMYQDEYGRLVFLGSGARAIAMAIFQRRLTFLATGPMKNGRYG